MHWGVGGELLFFAQMREIPSSLNSVWLPQFCHSANVIQRDVTLSIVINRYQSLSKNILCECFNWCYSV